jgi:hypothetical protein
MDQQPEVEVDPVAEALLAELRDVAARLDPIPVELDASVRASLAWRSLDAELAALTYDSVEDDRALAAVRSAGDTRLLHFETDGVSVELQVTIDGDRRDVVGELEPAGRAEIELRHPDATVLVTSDDHGRFRAEQLPAGPTSLRVRLAGHDDAAIVTDWLAI